MIRFFLLLLLNITIMGCQPGIPAEDAASPADHHTAAYHYSGAGKKAAAIMTIRSGPPVVDKPQSWVIRVMDENGIPVETAEILMTFAAPVSSPVSQRAVGVDDYEGDGFYRVNDLVFIAPGEWHLDLVVQWTTTEDNDQEDHLQIDIDVQPGPE